MNRTRKQKKCYAQVSNTIAGDPYISLKAKGLFLFMESKPDGWNFTIRSMAKQIKDGVDSISSALKELKKYGYVIYYKQKDGTGIYELIDEPDTENPDQDNPNLGKPERISNKDYLVKKIYKEAEGEISQKDFIGVLRSKYIGKPIKIDDIDYYFASDGYLKTCDGDRRLSSGRALDLYRRMYLKRDLLVEYLEAKYRKEEKR